MIPVAKPRISGLNCFYVDVERLLEHYRVSGTAGCIHFNGRGGEGVVYFGPERLIGATFRDRQGEVGGNEAIARIKDVAARENCLIDIYEMPEELALFWANTQGARVLYENLSSDLTELPKLVSNMAQERRTGSIEISFGDPGERAILFFLHGDLVRGACSWNGELGQDKEGLIELLHVKASTEGAAFTVKEFSLEENVDSKAAELPPREDKSAPAASKDEILALLEAVLHELERRVSKKNKHEEPFELILKRKLLDKAEEFPYLDPFADEFSYKNGKIFFDGDASIEEFARGLMLCLGEIAKEWGVEAAMRDWMTRLDAGHSALVHACLAEF